jgi:hypothetical protein
MEKVGKPELIRGGKMGKVEKEGGTVFSPSSPSSPLLLGAPDFP